MVKNLLAMQETWEMQFRSLSRKKNLLEEELATHSYSCLESPMDRRAWWAAIRGCKKSDMTEHTHIVTKGFNSKFPVSLGYIIHQDRRGCRSERKHLSNTVKAVSLEQTTLLVLC